MVVKVKKLFPYAELPKKAHKDDAGYDLVAGCAAGGERGVEWKRKEYRRVWKQREVVVFSV